MGARILKAGYTANREHSTDRLIQGGMFRRGKVMTLLRRISGLFRGPSFRVVAQWDPEAGVWYVAASDVPGLVTEAESVENLLKKLRVMIPELLELNGMSEEHIQQHHDVPLELLVKDHQLAHAGCP